VLSALRDAAAAKRLFRKALTIRRILSPASQSLWRKEVVCCRKCRKQDSERGRPKPVAGGNEDHGYEVRNERDGVVADERIDGHPEQSCYNGGQDSDAIPQQWAPSCQRRIVHEFVPVRSPCLNLKGNAVHRGRRRRTNHLILFISKSVCSQNSVVAQNQQLRAAGMAGDVGRASPPFSHGGCEA